MDEWMGQVNKQLATLGSKGTSPRRMHHQGWWMGRIMMACTFCTSYGTVCVYSPLCTWTSWSCGRSVLSNQGKKKKVTDGFRHWTVCGWSCLPWDDVLGCCVERWVLCSCPVCGLSESWGKAETPTSRSRRGAKVDFEPQNVPICMCSQPKGTSRG